jgi:hypothetical protein
MSKPTKRKFSEGILRDRGFLGKVKIDSKASVPKFKIIYSPRKDEVEVGDLVISHSYLFGENFDTGHAAIIAKKLDAQGREVADEMVVIGGVMSGVVKESIENQHEINAIIRFEDQEIKDLLSDLAITAATNPGKYSLGKIFRMWLQGLRGEEFKQSKIQKYGLKIENMLFARMLGESENISKEVGKIKEMLDGKNPLVIEKNKIARIERIRNELKDPDISEEKRKIFEKRIQYLSRSLDKGSVAKQEKLIKEKVEKLNNEYLGLEKKVEAMGESNFFGKSWNREEKAKLEFRLKEIDQSRDELKREFEILKEEKTALREESVKLKDRQGKLLTKINKFREERKIKAGSPEENKIKKEALTVFCSHFLWIVLQAALAAQSEGSVPKEISDAPGTVKPSGILEKFKSAERLSTKSCPSIAA